MTRDVSQLGPDDMLSPEEVASYLNVPLSAVRAWRLKGIGPPGARMGKYVRYRRRGIDAWADKQTKVAV